MTTTLGYALVGLGIAVVAWVVVAGRGRVAERPVQIALGLAFPVHFRFAFRGQA